MYAAVSGLKTHMDALNVIGNNIANVNTFGYKTTRYTFNEALYANVRAGSNGTEELGGRNPAQTGFGCSIGTIDLNMGTSTPSPTGQPLDCMIDGDGMFLVGDKTKTGVSTQSALNGMELTRVGNFEFKDGYMVDGNGKVVYGFLNTADPSLNPSFSPILTPIRFPWYNDKTKEIFMPSESEDESSLAVLDNEEALTAWSEAHQAGQESQESDYMRLKVDTLSIDQNSGQITAITSEDIQVVIGVVAIGKVDSPNGLTHTDGRYFQALGGAGNIHLTTVGGVVRYPPVSATGEIQEAEEGRLVVDSSGETKLISGVLEASGTDLADEISHMIVIQRGYQANTRIVTVTDSMLEELVNMKR
ncbi:MAG: flagellar hook-basal body complex protein [Oscillibacter sp.]|nr:flagellar hook-basal body complex protein [Oscillibacter sp.]